ncbi:anti-sigma factor RsbA family regulatory protein [Rugosimonospora africana]|uniref:Anti-sigma regulatory factor n=1 Tax=Rugosimonospora africana TaxID=556532 RepID=A0A8J3VQ07_9ACTN|nr:anti-sigma factor RsbA family regulatory protein [Rugosimonospora africana]GIH14649.1 anti-sigma regulatory factor [Rugosimonospora africana]
MSADTVRDEDHQVGTPVGLAHEALLYRGTDELVAAIVPVVRDALAAGEPVLVAMPGPNLDLLAAALGDAADGLRLVDMAEAGRNPGRIIPWILHAFIQEHAGRRVRIVGEPVWAGRTDEEYPACAQHEALVNVTLAGCAAAIVCLYDVSGLAPHVLTDAKRTHPVMLGEGRRWSSPDYRPETVVGAYNQPLPDVPSSADAVDFDGTGLAGLRDLVADHARRAGMIERRVVDFQLAVNELVSNAVLHGAGGGTLWIWTVAGAVACEVRDRGRAVVPLAGRVPPGPGSVRGRGLVLVNYVSDLVRIHTQPDGTAIRLYMRF